MESQLREEEKECQALMLEREKMEAQLRRALPERDKKIKALELKSSTEPEAQRDPRSPQITTEPADVGKEGSSSGYESTGTALKDAVSTTCVYGLCV